MKFLRSLFGRKGGDTAPSQDSLEQSYRDTIGGMTDDNAPLALGEQQSGAAPSANIWDLEGGGSTELPTEAPVPQSAIEAANVAASAAARSPARSRRTKTRLIGFDKSDGDVVDIFSDTPKVEAAATPVKMSKFPVGWIVVTDGPGRGEGFAIFAGMSQIGRGDDQAVQLDFGDNSISRTNHAAIVYDPETREFTLGHGGKSNIVRLNDKPLISNETLSTGDVMRIGETVLRFVALCGEDFTWEVDDEDGEDDEDVAIA